MRTLPRGHSRQCVTLEFLELHARTADWSCCACALPLGQQASGPRQACQTRSWVSGPSFGSGSHDLNLQLWEERLLVLAKLLVWRVMQSREAKQVVGESQESQESSL